MLFLYICQHDPFETTGGGSMASHAYLRAFSDYSRGNLDLICASSVCNKKDANLHLRSVQKVKERSQLSKFLSIFNGHLNRYISFVKSYLLSNKGVYDVVVFDHSCISGPLVVFANNLGLKTITIHHNYEKEYFEDNHSAFVNLLFLHHVKRWERLAYLNSNVNLFLTSQDRETFKNVYGDTIGTCDVIGAFEFYDYQKVQVNSKITSNSITFAITGTLSSFQTIDAITFFFKDLYQHLPKNSKVIIAGRNPGEEIQGLCANHSNVQLIPNPEDMNDVLSKADVYLSATRLGGGLKLRVMDGLKNGLPVVTHSCSARGFDLFYGMNIFKSYNTPKEFKTAVDEVVKEILNGNIDRQSVMDLYRNIFSYEAGLKRLNDILRQSNLNYKARN